MRKMSHFPCHTGCLFCSSIFLSQWEQIEGVSAAAALQVSVHTVSNIVIESHLLHPDPTDTGLFKVNTFLLIRFCFKKEKHKEAILKFLLQESVYYFSGVINNKQYFSTLSQIILKCVISHLCFCQKKIKYLL